MTDAIWAGRFLNRGTEPAWHRLGITTPVPMTAREALDLVGHYNVRLEPIHAAITDGPTIELGYSIIVREPTPDDPNFVVFGSPVTSDYELITPSDACQLWDEALDCQPIETLGVLKEGKELFISAKIADIDVRGDEVAMYLVLDSPMYSNNAANGVITGFRPVCANTLALGIINAIVKQTVVHLPGAKERMKAWIRKAYVSSVAAVEEAKVTFEHMASVRMGVEDTQEALNEIYPYPPAPQQEWVGQFGNLTFEEHMDRYQEKCANVDVVKDVIFGLFGGDGIALGTAATEGTAFGLYNAVAEYEDNRRGPAASTAISVLVGDRASTIRKAYKVLAAREPHIK